MPDHRLTAAFAVDRNRDAVGDAGRCGSGGLEDGSVAIRQPADTTPAACPVGITRTGPIRQPADVTPAARPAAMTRAGSTAAVLTATLALAAASWVVALSQMRGMDMGVGTELGSLGFFAALWASMMAAMMLPGAAPAIVRRVHASGRVLDLPVFVVSYLAVWTLVGLAAYAVYRPHGPLAAAAVVIAAGVYELTPLKRHFRRRCRQSARSGLEFGLCCVGSSIGLMLMLLALGVMSITWMSVIAVIVLAQKLLPARAATDVPLALAIVGLGIWIAIAPSSLPGLMPLM